MTAYNVWLDVKKHMPEANRFYFVTDGNSTSLAIWNIEKIYWNYKYMTKCFKPTHMLAIKLPPIGNLGEQK